MVGDGGGGEVGDGQVRILISDNCKQIRLTVSHKYDTDQLRTQEILLLFLLCGFLVLLIKLQTLISTWQKEEKVVLNNLNTLMQYN